MVGTRAQGLARLWPGYRDRDRRNRTRRDKVVQSVSGQHLHSLWGACGPAQESPQVGLQGEKSRISHFPPVYIPVHPRPWCNLEKGQGSPSKSSRLNSQLLGWVEWKNRFLKVTWVIWEKSPGIPKTCCWARGLIFMASLSVQFPTWCLNMSKDKKLSSSNCTQFWSSQS